MNHGRRVARCVLVWAAATAAALAVAGWASRTASPAVVTAGPSTGRFDTVLVVVSSWALVGCAAWAWLATTMVVLEALRGAVHAPSTTTRLVPGALRRAILLACGVAVLAATTGTAAHGAPQPAERDEQPAPGALHGLPLPDRQTGPAVPSPPDAPGTGARSVEVRPGDSLWRLAERQLGPDAEVADVAAQTWATYAINRDLIGADPDLIHPGQRLRLPEPPDRSPTDD